MINKLLITLIGSLIILLASNYQVFAQEQFKEYVGAINGNLKIRMFMFQDNNNISGTYIYEKVGREINISGSKDSAQNITLKESTPEGKQTGIFKGRFVTEDSIEGNWSKADGSTSFPFNLKAISFNANAINGTYNYKEDNVDNSITITSIDAKHFKIKGDATFIRDAAAGAVYTGEAEGKCELINNSAIYINDAKAPADEQCRFKIYFIENGLLVIDDSGHCGGLDVTFTGLYKKAKPRSSKPQ